MDGFFAILVICLIIEYKIVHNYSYKKGKNEADRNLKLEGYELGKKEMKDDFYKLLRLPDDEFYDNIEKIRKKINDENKSETE